MRSHFKASACLAAVLLASSTSVLAQTGEFAATVPGSVVHEGYALQDWLQDLRNGTREPPPVPETAQSTIIIVPPPAEPNPARPKKTAKKVTTSSQVQPKPLQ